MPAEKKHPLAQHFADGANPGAVASTDAITNSGGGAAATTTATTKEVASHQLSKRSVHDHEAFELKEVLLEEAAAAASGHVTPAAGGATVMSSVAAHHLSVNMNPQSTVQSTVRSVGV